MTMAAAMAAIGVKTLPKYAPKPFSIWGAQINSTTGRPAGPSGGRRRPARAGLPYRRIHVRASSMRAGRGEFAGRTG